MSHRDDLADRLLAGLNGDPDQRAATTLLIDACHGIWLTKLAGWGEYLVEMEDPRRPGALCIDWQQLRDDLTADAAAWDAFNAWADSWAGRRVSQDQFGAQRRLMVPPRPWHGASNCETTLLRIAQELAPGGLLGDGLNRLDPANTTAVLTAIDDLATGVPGHETRPRR